MTPGDTFVARSGRWAYSGLFYLAVPLIVIRFWLKGRRLPGYRSRLGERFGLGPPALARARVVIHCVSVGEVRGARGLIEALAQSMPEYQLLVTTTTPTGAEQVRQLQSMVDLEGRLEHAYLPLDLPDAMARFLSRYRPTAIILIETELWPNLITAAWRRKIPVVVANARLSERSFRRYQRVVRLVEPVVGRLHRVYAVADADAARFTLLGVQGPRIRVCGNLKFDVRLAPTRPRARPPRRIWMAVSTHRGEEVIALKAHRRLCALEGALLVLAPRHPERVEEVAQAAARAGVRMQRRTGLADSAMAHWWELDTDCLVVDTLGELGRFFPKAQVAVMGGSLVPVGGHNPLEAAAHGVALLTGPHVWNFAEIFDRLGQVGALVRLAVDGSDVDAVAAILSETVDRLLGATDERAAMAEAGLGLIASSRGATDCIVEAMLADLADLTPVAK